MSPSERPEDIEAYVREHREEISLDPYQEIRGRLDALVSDDRFVYIELSSGTLRFELDSAEARICDEHLTGNEGTHVSILRTGDPIKCVLVMVDESTAKGALSSLSLGRKRKSES